MINRVRVLFNGKTADLPYDEAEQAWKGTITPDATSFHQTDGYYSLKVWAGNDSGGLTAVSGNTNIGLRLIVNERIPPTLTLISPSEGYITTNKPEIIFYAEDESGGSGIDIDSLKITVDNAVVTGAKWQTTASGYRISYKATTALSDGPHTIEIQISDNDGNAAVLNLSYIVDTIPPVLVVSEPMYRSVVDWTNIEVLGEAKDATEPVTVTVSVNDVTYSQTTVHQPIWKFGFDVPLNVGGNHITITAKDGAGMQSSKTLFIIRLVTDRNRDDLTTLTKLLEKPYATWTTEEKSEFLQAKGRGSYNYSDLNRVNLAAGHLAKKLGGFTLTFDELSPGRTQWGEDDWPTPELMGNYLDNVDTVSRIAPIQTILPKDMEGLTFAEANAIESALVELDSFTQYLRNTFLSGEFYSGEI